MILQPQQQNIMPQATNVGGGLQCAMNGQVTPKAKKTETVAEQEPKTSRTDVCNCPEVRTRNLTFSQIIEERVKPTRSGGEDIPEEQRQLVTYARGRFLGKVS